MFRWTESKVIQRFKSINPVQKLGLRSAFIKAKDGPHFNLVWVLAKGGRPAEPGLLAVRLDQLSLSELGGRVGDPVTCVSHVHQQRGGAQSLLLCCHGTSQGVQILRLLGDKDERLSCLFSMPPLSKATPPWTS